MSHVNRNIKIAHVTTIDRSLSALLLNQMLSFINAGYAVVGISSPGPSVPTIEKAGIRHIPVMITRSKRTPFQDLKALWQLYRLFRREQFTIVHTHTPKASFLGQVAAKLVGIPIIVRTVHGFYFHEYMPTFFRYIFITLEKIAAKCSDVILSQNKEDIETAVRKGIAPPGKVKYLGNGINVQRFNPHRFSSANIAKKRVEIGLRENVPVVGFVGRLAARRKGFLDFLQAAQLVKQDKPDTQFLIIGERDSGKEDAVKPEVAKRFGIWDACFFLGRRPNYELPLLYLTMDLLILPSLFEGVPRVVMEASAMGKPAIVTNVKGNREAVTHGDNGLLVPLGEPKALAKAIIELLNDSEKMKHMGKESRSIALNKFDERLVFTKVQKEYARLLHEKGL